VKAIVLLSLSIFFTTNIESRKGFQHAVIPLMCEIDNEESF